MKPVYFLSDAHLGSWAIEHRRMQERRLVRFLDSIKEKAAAVYLLGDMFDFWYEFKYVVPRGYTRFLGKISELTDMGVEVHYFTGNHDIWMYGYLEQECGVILHVNLVDHPKVKDIDGNLRVVNRFQYVHDAFFYLGLLFLCHKRGQKYNIFADFPKIWLIIC